MTLAHIFLHAIFFEEFNADTGLFTWSITLHKNAPWTKKIARKIARYYIHRLNREVEFLHVTLESSPVTRKFVIPVEDTKFPEYVLILDFWLTGNI